MRRGERRILCFLPHMLRGKDRNGFETYDFVPLAVKLHQSVGRSRPTIHVTSGGSSRVLSNDTKALADAVSKGAQIAVGGRPGAACFSRQLSLTDSRPICRSSARRRFALWPNPSTRPMNT